MRILKFKQSHLFLEYIIRNNTFKVTPEGCISYYADSNYLVKDCGDIIYKSRVFNSVSSVLLANYSWIDFNRVVLSFHPTYMSNIHDAMIFVYNIKTHEKEISYNFESSGLVHWGLSGVDSIRKGKNIFFYDVSYNRYFAPIFNNEDSSLIIALMPAAYKRNMSNGFAKKDLDSTKILLKIYPKSTNKRAEFLPIVFADAAPICAKEKFYNLKYYTICGIYNSDNNEIIVSTEISNTTLKYQIQPIRQDLLTDRNYMFPSCIGYDTVSSSGKSEFATFKDFFYDPKYSRYYRQITFSS